MYLTFRSTEPKDFEACFKLMHNRFVFTKTKTEKALKSFWDQTLKDNSAIARVLVDQDRPEGKNIMAMGFSVFATDSFIEELKASPSPYPFLQVLRSLKRGKKPLLSLPEIARQNGGEGLNDLALAYGWNERLSDEVQQAILLKLIESFQSAHAGWQWKQFVMEVYGPKSKANVEGLGMKVLRDYRESPPQPSPPASFHPYLTGIRRGERSVLEGDYFYANLFNYTPPRFRFSAGEKEILTQSLEGKIDLEIAKYLHLSPWTIKKRWQGVYRKVDQRDSSLLKPGRSPAEALKEAPDLQRRRRLLEYLRHHMEEIRPIIEPRHR